MKKVADVMTTSPVTLRTNVTVRDALAMLETLEIRHLPVVDEHRALVGVVSERDLHSVYAPRKALALGAVEQARSALDRPVSTVMIATPWSIEENTSIADAARKIIDARVSALPVVRGETLVGVVSYVDLLRVLVESLTR